ncbi:MULTISPECIES: carbohydrate ABC transporter permease [Thermoanaerobacterium]|uniref:ABC transporter n=2 Tax=Thermoanaerobacterium TaxID=28895 RepID=W9E906_9THEO|nr:MULTISPECIES: sugar ABC transporter permease [Thermoanaerobacterium]AFK86176.1 ABC-type transporter, integral membrane subunit [Thermoanaerobacterium saccharolyticum JW/SL-YS485]ETO37330.1 ABC transporter [Thermoanaerobacterium aotearoense SCUT27]
MNKRLTLKQRNAIIGLTFILPWLIGFLIYYVGSLFLTIQFSLSKVIIGKTGGYTTSFIGISNFKNTLLVDPNFNQVLVNSIIDILIDIPFIIFFSLFIAILLNQKFKGRAFVRAIFFLPILLTAGAVQSSLQLATQHIMGGASAMMKELTPSIGVNVNYFLGIFQELGLPSVLVDYVTSLVSRIFDIVRASSVQIIIFIAALQSIPNSLYESAKIEGATSYEIFWKITLPIVTPLILANVVYTVVDSFVNSNVVELAFNEAFTNYNYGLSAAMSILSTVAILLILGLITLFISRRTFYYN